MEQNVDFNYLYERHQVSLYMAEHAASEEARQAHLELAARYRARIAVGKQPNANPGRP
jgi:hypothetical protein